MFNFKNIKTANGYKIVTSDSFGRPYIEQHYTNDGRFVSQNEINLKPKRKSFTKRN